MLSRRAAGARRRIGGVSVLLAPGSRAVAIDIGPDTVEAWAEREREALQPPPSPLPKPAEGERRTIKVSDLPKDSSLRTTAETLAGMSGAIEAAMKASAIGAGALGWESDRRTPEDYAKQVDGYIAKARKVLPSVLLKSAHARGLGRIRFLVRNNTDDPIHGLQVEVRIAAKGVMGLDEDEIPAKDLPARPVMLGKGGRNRFDYLGGVSLAGLTPPRYDYMTPAMSIGRRVRIDNSNSVTLTFDPLDLYAEEEADLEEVWLFANPALAGTTLTAQWNARSRDASGVMRETLEIEVDPVVPPIDDLLAETEQPLDDEENEDDEDDEDDED